MKVFKYIVKFLVIIGSLNLGVMGVANYDVLGSIFGGMSMMTNYSTGPRIVFVIIGIAALLSLICVLKHCCCGCNDNHKKGGGCCR